MNTEFLQYPIGKPSIESEPGRERIEGCIAVIGRMPKQLMEFAKVLTEEQWDTPYREGGWTVRQVVHHLADSHMNGFNRQRLAVTNGNTPKVPGYSQTLYAALPDYSTDPFLSVILLASLHEKMGVFKRNYRYCIDILSHGRRENIYHEGKCTNVCGIASIIGPHKISEEKVIARVPKVFYKWLTRLVIMPCSLKV